MGSAVFMGIALASRPNWILLLPIPFFYIAQHSNYKVAIKMIIATLISFSIFVLPFYLYDPQHYSPLHVSNKLTLNGTFPHADILVASITGIAAIVLGIRFGAKSINHQIKTCFIVQVLAIISGFILASFSMHGVNLVYPNFGILFLFFGVYAYGPKLIRDALDRGSSILLH